MFAETIPRSDSGVVRETPALLYTKVSHTGAFKKKKTTFPSLQLHREGVRGTAVDRFGRVTLSSLKKPFCFVGVEKYSLIQLRLLVFF